jgi:hypothetical protein
MDLKKQFSYITLCFIVLPIILFSCTKEDEVDTSLFYGSWKTSYGDTIVFSRTGNKNMLNYDVSMNPAFAPRANNEFTYNDDKLGLKDGFGGSGSFRFFDSFRWIQKGSIFEIEQIQWFTFVSSMRTYFIFTKIP